MYAEACQEVYIRAVKLSSFYSIFSACLPITFKLPRPYKPEYKLHCLKEAKEEHQSLQHPEPFPQILTKLTTLLTLRNVFEYLTILDK